MEKINIAEILKDCPKGIELYSPIFGNCKLLKIYTGLGFDVISETGDVFNFLYDGRYTINGECLIFPSKENRDWSKFKIEITMQTESQDTSSITKEKMPYRANLCISGYTELEIPESFDINIKGNIICLTPKTLEFLVVKEFNDGDIVATTYGDWIGITNGGESVCSVPTYCVIKSNGKFEAYFDKKERWLFDRLATEAEKEKLFKAIKEHGYKWNAETKTLEKLIEPKFKVGDRIKYAKTEHIRIVKKLEYDRYILDNNNYLKFCDAHAYKVVKFDISTLNPFDKVLVRLDKYSQWYATWFSHIDEKYECYGSHYVTVAGKSYTRMIPYEGNEHLLGKTDDCDEYYKTWE